MHEMYSLGTKHVFLNVELDEINDQVSNIFGQIIISVVGDGGIKGFILEFSMVGDRGINVVQNIKLMD